MGDKEPVGLGHGGSLVYLQDTAPNPFPGEEVKAQEGWFSVEMGSGLRLGAKALAFNIRSAETHHQASWVLSTYSPSIIHPTSWELSTAAFSRLSSLITAPLSTDFCPFTQQDDSSGSDLASPSLE